MKKKLLAMLLSGILVFSSIALVACGDGGTNDVGNDDATVADESNGEADESAQAAPTGEREHIYIIMPHEGSEIGRNDIILGRIQEEFPDVDFTMESVPGDESDYATRIRTLIAAGGDGIDVWWDRGGSWVIPLFEANAVLALDDYLDNIPGFWDTVMHSAIIPHYDGHVYAIPCEEVFYAIILYNTEIFDDLGLSPPETAEELREVIRTIQGAEDDIIPIVLSAGAGWPAAMFVENFALTLDMTSTERVVNGEVPFSETSYREAAEFVQELLDMGAFDENVALADSSEVNSLFITGQAAMFATASWYLSPRYRDMDGNVDWFFYPVLDGGDVSLLGTHGSGGVKVNAGSMVYAGTANRQLATEVAASLSRNFQRYLYEVLETPFVVYHPDLLGWDHPVISAPSLRLVEIMNYFTYTYNFVQDVMPTAPGTSMLMNSSSQFFANMPGYGVEEYLDDLDRSLLEE